MPRRATVLSSVTRACCCSLELSSIQLTLKFVNKNIFSRVLRQCGSTIQWRSFETVQSHKTKHTTVRTPEKSNGGGLSWIGVLMSFTLHVLFLAPVVSGHFWSTAGTAPDSDRPAEMILTLIDDVDATSFAPVAGRMLDNPSLSRVSLLQVASPAVPPSNTNLGEDQDTPETHYFDPGQEMLQNSYIRQIKARIERAWMRPRAPIRDASAFKCRILLTQSRRGEVQEVELVSCNGNSRWQTSLVHAIQSASPLPAPPMPDLFATRLLLDIDSEPFDPKGPVDGFEPHSSDNL